MLVSVIVAAYNVERHLPRAVASLQKQFYRNWEAIIIDDASSDQTYNVAIGLSEADDRIRVIRCEKNGGPSVARNIGLKIAQGDYIAILDADDAFHATRLSRLVRIACDQRADVVFDNLLFFDDQSGQVTSSAFPFSEEVVLLTIEDLVKSERPGQRFRLGFLKPLFRSSFLSQNGLVYADDLRLAEDFLLFAQTLLLGGKAMLVLSPGYLYTTQIGEQSGLRSSGTRTLLQYGDRVMVADRLLELARQRAPSALPLLERYRRWMKEAKTIVEITGARTRSKSEAFAIAAKHPRAAFRYMTSSGTMKRAMAPARAALSWVRRR